MNQRLSNISKGPYILNHYNYEFHHNHPQMCLYMIKNIEKGHTLTRFGYTLKNLNLNKLLDVYAIHCFF
jgi:hypothetical protein